MEKKTIGGFIAALRKANGMTQKELAERLNVSDKTVSRWERDDGSPDLSVIPVIAEIFNVTCDELLRGERKSPSARAEAPADNESTPKGEKQRQRMLKSTLSQYQTYTYIAMGVSTVGMIAALVCNLAFLKAVLGFLIGASIFVASIVCQAIALNRAFLSVEDFGLDETELAQFKRSVIQLAQKSIGLTVTYIGFTFPLVLMDAYIGLSVDNMFIFGTASAVIALLIYAVICYFFNASLLKKGTYSLSEKEATVYYHNHMLKRKCAIALAILLSLTFIAHQVLTIIWGPGSVMKGTVFNDYESFIEYMEQDIPHQPLNEFNDGTTAIEPVDPSSDSDATTWYDEFGNEISEEEARHRTLEDKNGNVVCEYIERNESVVSIRYSAKDGTVLPITVFTYNDLQEAKEIVAIRHVIFTVIYVLELSVVLIYYFRKRMK